MLSPSSAEGGNSMFLRNEFTRRHNPNNIDIFTAVRTSNLTWFEDRTEHEFLFHKYSKYIEKATVS
jgi:hypothetical protein